MIHLSLSSKTNKSGKREILIRLFQGSRINMRGKSRIFIDDKYFYYDIDVEKTIEKGVALPSSQRATLDDAKRKGYILKNYGEMHIPATRTSIYEPERQVTIQEARISKETLDALVKYIETAFNTLDKKSIPKGWLEDKINYFHNKSFIDAENKRKALEEEQHRIEAERKATENKKLVNRYKKYIETVKVAKGTLKGYKVTLNILCRYVIIKNHEDLHVDEVDPQILIEIADFIRDEYKYMRLKKWESLYEDTVKRDEVRRQSYVASKMSDLLIFFKHLSTMDEIEKSPFDKLDANSKAHCLREPDPNPHALTLNELKSILATDVPSSLEITKKAFLLQCAIGVRISEYQELNMNSVKISDSGIPYLRYFPAKTRKGSNDEINTPLVKFAYEIILETGFTLPIIHYPTGENGYNQKIKELLRTCNITREVMIRDVTEEKHYVPICEIASSKMGRSTYVTLVKNIQLDFYNGGLHKTGSRAVDHYYEEILKYKNRLVCLAYNEPEFRVNSSGDIILNEND